LVDTQPKLYPARIYLRVLPDNSAAQELSYFDSDYFQQVYKLLEEQYGLTEEMATFEEFMDAFDGDKSKYDTRAWPRAIRLEKYERFLVSLFWEKTLVPYISTTTEIFDILYPNTQTE
jgi:hypothetical protein